MQGHMALRYMEHESHNISHVKEALWKEGVQRAE